MRNYLLGGIAAAGVVLLSSFTMAQVGFDEVTSEEITVEEVGPDYAVIKFPILMDEDGMLVTKYALFYSTQPIDEAEPTAIEQVNIDIEEETPQQRIEDDYVVYRLEGLQPGTTYYFAIAPIFEDANGEEILGESSTYKSFTTLEEAPAEPEEAHNVPPAQAVIDNVSHSISGNELTVTWTYAGPENVVVDVYVVNPATAEAVKVTTVPATDQKATFNVAEGGDLVVRLVPVDAQTGEPAGAQVEYAVKLETQKTEPEVQTPPKVGPATNLLIAISIVLFIAYIIYAYRKEES